MTGGAVAVAGVVGRRRGDDGDGVGVATAWTRTTRGRRHLLHALASHDDEDEEFDDDDDEDEEVNAVAPLPSLEASDATRAMGERLILDAACDCGATEKMMTVEWKGERIVVTVDVYADEDYDHDVEDYDDEDDDDDDDDDDIEGEDYVDEDYDEIDWDGDDDVVGRDESYDTELDIDEINDTDEGYDDVVGKTKRRKRVDLTKIARAINGAFARDAPDGPGYAVAMTHEIEVTTPIFDGVLRGRRMFDSYRGFDVIVEHLDGVRRGKRDVENGKTRKGGGYERGVDDDALCDDDGGSAVGTTTMDDNGRRKIKTTQGKLVGREYGGAGEDGFTTINVKGRAVRIRNDDILNVSLPKAKREKGAK